MANTLKIKRSAVASKVPTTGDLQLGELAINTYDGKLYTKKDNGVATIVEIGAGGGVSDGDKGDITVASSGTSWTIDNGAVTYAKIQNVTSARLLGRSTAGAGVAEEISIGSGLSLSGGTLSNTGAVADGDKGDITVSASGATWTVDNAAITYAKIQNVSATDKLLGRSTIGAGVVEEITCTAAGRALIDDVDAAAQRTTLGLGTLATQSGTFSGTSSGTNTGDQTITLTGDVTGSGTGSFAATIANSAVTYAKIQNVSATDKLLGRSTAGAGVVEEIACTAAGRSLIAGVDAAAQRTTLGLGTLATQSALGNITSAGAIGVTANLPVITTTSGALTTGTFGTTANTFCQGNDSRLSDTRNTTNALTFNNGGAGAASGSTFNGSSAVTVSYNTVGAAASNQTMFIGTTSVAINRTSANLALTGISSVAFPGSTSGTATLQATATAGTPTLSLPITTGTLIGSGDTGTVSTAMIAGSAVTYAKIQNVSATDKILGRSTAGAGVVEEITCTAAARTLLDDTTTAAMLTTLSAAQSGAGGAIVETAKTISANYTLTANFNGITAGPITINSGVTVTVPSGAAWVIV